MLFIILSQNLASGMSAEVAGLSVLSGVKMASNGVLNATKLSVGAIDIIEGAFKISFPAINAATRTGLRIAGSVIGAMAAAFDIADMIYSWVTGQVLEFCNHVKKHPKNTRKVIEHF